LRFVKKNRKGFAIFATSAKSKWFHPVNVGKIPITYTRVLAKKKGALLWQHALLGL
jgi:hypothetical protein